MTTATLTGSRSQRVSTAVVFRRALAAEWTRLRTVRSTWWALLAGAALMLLIGTAFGVDAKGDPIPIWLAAEFAIIPAQFAFVLLPMLAVTADYSNTAIHSTLQWVPRRGILFTARTIVPLVVATIAAVLLSVATDLVAGALMGESAIAEWDDIARSVGNIAIYVGSAGLLGAGLAWLLRSTAGVITCLFMLQLALPMFLPDMEVAWRQRIAESLPGYAGASLLDSFGLQFATSSAAIVLTAWVTVALVVGGWSLLNRDAT